MSDQSLDMVLWLNRCSPSLSLFIENRLLNDGDTIDMFKATTGGEKANFQTECWSPVVALTNCLEP